MCIYLTNQQNLTYENAEHIIPAGLGGKQKLPNEYVSDQFNNFISKYEQSFLRSSILSLPRQILGPGKRGSLLRNKQTKSKISVFSQLDNENLYSLGFMEKGKPYDIPSITLNVDNGETHIGFPKENFEKVLQGFKNSLGESNFKIRLIKFKALEKSTFIFGFKSGIEENYNCFIASREGKDNPFNQNILNQFIKTLSEIQEFPAFTSSKVKVHQGTQIDLSYYRCCAKIAFNYLAFIKDEAFVSQKNFDKIRNLIVNGENDELVQILPVHNSNLPNIYPKDSHQIIITQIENKLVANVCLYDHFNQGILLSDDYKENFALQGFICDWQNEKEYDLNEYIALSLQ